MQGCCGSEDRPVITEEMKATSPECLPENIEGKIQTAGYTACL